MLVWGLLFRAMGILLMPFLSAYCLVTGVNVYPMWAYYFDNDEDGFTGDKRNWYSNYLGFDISSRGKLYQWYRAVRWQIRNMSFNHRYHHKCGVDITKPEIISFKGNTWHHEPRYSHNPDVIEVKWYKMTAIYEGKTLTSEFTLTPVFKRWSWRKFRFVEGLWWKYRRKGLKIYPANYFDPWWIAKIAVEGWPKYKTHGVMTNIARVREYE